MDKLTENGAIDSILDKFVCGTALTREDAVALLETDNKSDSFYRIIAAANAASRRQYGNRGYIFAQIGINSEPCSGNCKFCSMARDYFSVDAKFSKRPDEIVHLARDIAGEDIEALFLMTTADYDKERFLEIGRMVKEILPDKIQFVANIGDFDSVYAKRLVDTGFTGAYHIVRLREGEDTDIPKESRIATLDAIKEAGLDLYYCIEPIGREHTYEEIADEMLRARSYGVDVMAVMGRVGIPGSAFEGDDDISEIELTKIAAVTRLVTNPQKSMNVHEPKKFR